MQKKFVKINNKIENFNKKINVDGDKSLSIRWALLSSQAIGISKAKNLLKSDDVQNTLNCLKKLGVKIVQGACREPLRQMCLNAGESPDIIVCDVERQEKNFGYDFGEQKMVDLVERGVIDPARVTRCALQNSVSVAGTLITSNFAIVEV